jgi:hypothetical protein
MTELNEVLIEIRRAIVTANDSSDSAVKAKCRRDLDKCHEKLVNMVITHPETRSSTDFGKAFLKFT